MPVSWGIKKKNYSSVTYLMMQIWLPPTPPSEDFEELCVDAALEMNYDTQTVISPAVLAAIAPFRWFYNLDHPCSWLNLYHTLTVRRIMMSLDFVDKLLTVVRLLFYMCSIKKYVF